MMKSAMGVDNKIYIAAASGTARYYIIRKSNSRKHRIKTRTALPEYTDKAVLYKYPYIRMV